MTSGDSLLHDICEVLDAGADPDKLRDAAVAWKALGSQIEEARSAAQKKTESVVNDDWHGQDSDAFREQWNASWAILKDFETECLEQARELMEAADDLDDILSALTALTVLIGGAGVILKGPQLLSLLKGIKDGPRLAAIATEAGAILARLQAVLQRVATSMRAGAVRMEGAVLKSRTAAQKVTDAITVSWKSLGDKEVAKTGFVFFGLNFGVPSGFQAATGKDITWDPNLMTAITTTLPQMLLFPLGLKVLKFAPLTSLVLNSGISTVGANAFTDSLKVMMPGFFGAKEGDNKWSDVLINAPLNGIAAVGGSSLGGKLSPQNILPYLNPVDDIGSGGVANTLSEAAKKILEEFSPKDE